jgi:hypothetical protein
MLEGEGRVLEADWEQMAALVSGRIQACRLDLRGWVVITEAATNAYAVTAASALASGAEVWALAKESRFGSMEDCVADVSDLVAALGCDPADVQFVMAREDLPFEAANLVTNSGFVRPITAKDIGRLQSGTRIALMYEEWEARSGDIDYRAAREAGIEVIGVNEKHPLCDAFRFVGMIPVKAAQRRDWLSVDTRIGVVSDNAFGPEIVSAFSGLGHDAVLLDGAVPPQDLEVMIVAATPSSVGGSQSREWATNMVLTSNAQKCVHVWGDLDYEMLEAKRLEVEPRVPPATGHQALGMETVGPEAVIRLQIAGMAAAVHADGSADDHADGLAQRHVELSVTERDRREEHDSPAIQNDEAT